MSRLLLGALCALLSWPTLAGPFAPGGNSGALARSFALPALGDRAPLAAGRTETALVLDLSNEYVREGVCVDECLVLDGETGRLRLTQRWGLGGGWDLGVDVPMLDEGGGFLDSWIQDWHGWFGLPNGGREQVAEDQFRYEYQRNGATGLLHDEPGDGLGDVTVTLGRQLGRGSALRAALKLPTAEGSLLGGGNTGGALWLDLALPVPRGWEGYVAGGVSLNERGDVLPQQQNEKVFFGGAGLLMPFIAGTRLHAQLQGHTRLYDDSALPGLSRPGVPLTLGLRFGDVEIGFQEDLSVNASPDFAVYLAMGK